MNKPSIKKIYNYTVLDKLGETKYSHVYRCRKDDEQETVVLKVLKSGPVSASEIARFKQESDIIKNLNIDGIVRTYDIIDHEGEFILVLEDFNGISINECLEKNKIFDIIYFLKTGIQILHTIGELHKSNIIHMDIKPDNILINPEENIVKITDFGISAFLTHENEEIYNPDIIQGTLLYMSPEQTGRINRSVDYRTDLYSLGATFYKMLTGRVPFESEDPLEIIHSHLAKEPAVLHTHNNNVPEILSSIILKLLSKNAEDRYQNAFGVLADFDKCLKQSEKTGRIETFELARHDFSNRFIIPGKLYGREKEIDKLISVFDSISGRIRVDSEEKDLYSGKSQTDAGLAEILLVSGSPGIGKSALINEINKPVVERKGYFILGKFDHFRRDTPYSAIIQALQKLLKQLLSESDEKLENMKNIFLEVLGTNGKIITDMIPEFEYIIGKQSEVVKLGPDEARNRFNVVFKKFLSVFAVREHPVVLFLDDLQWADVASLQIIEYLITCRELKYLLIIGSYRDNEISEKHPLPDILKEIKKTGIKIPEINLSELSVADIKNLVMDFLKCNEEKAFPLAEIIFNKTGGNPFFINEFLYTLYNEKLIILDSSYGWTWNIDKINEMGITENLVEFLSQKINKLPENIRDILKICACIGNRFELEDISILTKKSINTVLNLLTEAVKEGFLNSSGVYYFFNHDRVREAAYSLVPDKERTLLHLSIGRLMLEKSDKDELFKKFFYITDQLNIGKNLITDTREKAELAELNYDCGIKAKNSSAFLQAFEYFKAGIALLDNECWHTQYDLSIKIYSQIVESAYLNGNYDDMKHFASIVLKKAKNIHDAMHVYMTQIRANDVQMNFEASVDLCLEILQKLDYPIQKHPGKLRIKAAYLKIKPYLSPKKIDSLYNLPETTDSRILDIFTVFPFLASCSIYILPDLYIYIAFKQMKLSLKYGLSTAQSYTYIQTAIVLINTIGNVDAGYKLGKFGLYLLEKLDAEEYKSKASENYYLQIAHWKEHLKSVRSAFYKLYFLSMEYGDIETTAFSLCFYNSMGINLGAELTELDRQMHDAYIKLEQLNKLLLTSVIEFFHQVVLTLLGKSENYTVIDGTAFNKNKYIPEWEKQGIGTLLGTFYIHECMIRYIFNDYKGAIVDSRKSDPCLGSLSGGLAIRDYYFYGALARLAIYHEADNDEKREFRKYIKKSMKLNKLWAVHATMNYEGRVYLLEAEIARTKSDFLNAENLYERSIESSRRNEYLVEEALANELASKYYFSNDRNEIAKMYLHKAYACYTKWGATGKLRQLRDIYSEYLSPEIKSSLNITDTVSVSMTRDANPQIIDFTTIIKASQALSNEVVLGNLLEKMMKIVMENAGAQKGFMILEDQDKYLVEAEYSVDKKDISVLQSIPVDDHAGLSSSIVSYTARTKETVLLNDASSEGDFVNDQYIKKNKSRSVLCMPILNQSKLSGILYLENDLSSDAFTDNRCEVLNILSSQIAISIENAKFYEKLEQQVQERTKEAKEMAKRFKDIAFSSADWIWETNIDSEYIYCSKKVEDILGYKPEELIGKTPVDFLSSDEKEKIQNSISDTKKAYKTAKDLEAWHLTKDGKQKCILTNAIPVFDDGEFKGYRGVDKDITERKQAEIKLNELMNELTRSNQELEQFAYIASHDLQEPLRKIITFGSRIKENSDIHSNNKIMDYLERMENASKRMKSLIDGLLNYSRVTRKSQPFVEVDLNQVVNDALSDLEIRIQETGGNVNIDNLPVIKGDPLQIRQLFQNLISNALKFHKKDETPYIKIFASDDKNTQNSIVVEDNGIGIDEENFDKIFGVFQRLHGRTEFEGSGIGLAVCKKIVERHGGKIRVESVLGQGTKFSLDFPQ